MDIDIKNLPYKTSARCTEHLTLRIPIDDKNRIEYLRLRGVDTSELLRAAMSNVLEQAVKAVQTSTATEQEAVEAS